MQRRVQALRGTGVAILDLRPAPAAEATQDEDNRARRGGRHLAAQAPYSPMAASLPWSERDRDRAAALRQVVRSGMRKRQEEADQRVNNPASGVSPAPRRALVKIAAFATPHRGRRSNAAPATPAIDHGCCSDAGPNRATSAEPVCKHHPHRTKYAAAQAEATRRLGFARSGCGRPRFWPTKGHRRVPKSVPRQVSSAFPGQRDAVRTPGDGAQTVDDAQEHEAARTW